jgi:hypothetical protein
MTECGFDIFELLASGDITHEKRHDSLETAERLREMSSEQFAKVYILHLEGAIRLRGQYTSMGIDFYNQQKNNFDCWNSMMWSQAMNHRYRLEDESDTPSFCMTIY